jgi:hypothetical protein
MFSDLFSLLPACRRNKEPSILKIGMANSRFVMLDGICFRQ